MDKYIETANRILSKTAQNDQNASLGEVLDTAVGIALVSEQESYAATISGPVGGGIVLARDKETGHWSNPCACTLGGTGWGVGGTPKDIIVFILDEESMESFLSSESNSSSRVGTGLELSEGPSLAVGTFDAIDSKLVGSYFVSKSDAGLAPGDFGSSGGPGTLSIAFTAGSYVSASANGATLQIHRSNNEANQKFYGDAGITAQDILYLQGEEARMRPSVDRHSQLQELYGKLDNLSRGKNAKVYPSAYSHQVEVPREAPSAIADIAKETVSAQS